MKYGYFIWGYQLSTVYRHALSDRTWNTSLSISAKRLSDLPRITDLLTDDGETLSFLAISAVYLTIGQMSVFHERPEGAEEILRPGKQPERVRARSLACYWAVKELGMNGSAVAKSLW